jgi:hypothetical protein
VPRYPPRRKRRISNEVVALIQQARTEHEYGAGRTRIWLERVHQVRVTTQTIQRVFRDLGLPYLVKTRRRRPKQLKLFEKEHPGDSVQVDVKVVTRGRVKWFQYTAIDDCTRLRVLRLYRRQNHRSSLAFLRELRDALPVATWRSLRQPNRCPCTASWRRSSSVNRRRRPRSWPRRMRFSAIRKVLTSFC